MSMDISAMVTWATMPGDLSGSQLRLFDSWLNNLDFSHLPVVFNELEAILANEAPSDDSESEHPGPAADMAADSRLTALLARAALVVREHRIDLADGSITESNDDSEHDSLQVDPESLASIYLSSPESSVQIRGLSLQILTLLGTGEALERFTELMVESPPRSWQTFAIGVSPLFQIRNWPVDAVFPKLLDAIQFPHLAAMTLDLANYVARLAPEFPHPALSRKTQLFTLLGAMVQKLTQLEEDPHQFGQTVAAVQQVLHDSVSLTVALCDFCGLIGDPNAIGKLNQALGLAHRRIQTEAAGALARLGDEDGRKVLLELMQEPVARLRVLAYAEELNLTEQIDEQYLTPVSRAEAELALWLSQPQNFGLPPSELEVIDERTCYWPSYTEPQTCFLFRFHYQLPNGRFSNVGIAGPLTHAFPADLADLPIDDIYAAFAGWQAEHEDIYEVPASQWNSAQESESRRLQRSLTDQEHENIRPQFLGFFVGERALVARSRRGETDGVSVTDGIETLWFPTSSRPRPLGPSEAFSIYKGRKMLRTFNP